MRRITSSFAVVIIILLNGLAAFGTELLYDNGAPNDPRTGNGMTQWIEADDFTLTQASRVDHIRFWDFETVNGFQGTLLWQIYANTDNNTPGNLIAAGSVTNISRSATGIPVFGPFTDYVNDFDITPMYLPAGAYWLALHNGPLSNTVGTYLDVMYWVNTDNAGFRPGNSNIAPFNGPWESNYFPPYDSELAFLVNGVPAPRITSCSFSTNQPQVSFTSEAGETYRLVYKDDLSEASWTTVNGAASVSGTGGIITVSDPDVTAKTHRTRFYRVEML